MTQGAYQASSSFMASSRDWKKQTLDGSWIRATVYGRGPQKSRHSAARWPWRAKKFIEKKKNKKKPAAPSNRNATNWFCLLDFVFSVVFVLFFFSNYFPDAEGHRPLAVEAKNEKKMKKTHTHTPHTHTGTFGCVGIEKKRNVNVVDDDDDVGRRRRRRINKKIEKKKGHRLATMMMMMLMMMLMMMMMMVGVAATRSVTFSTITEFFFCTGFDRWLDWRLPTKKN